MMNTDQILGKEVDRAREVFPFVSNIVTPRVTPMYGICSKNKMLDPNGTSITEAMHRIGEERTAVVEALKANYNESFIDWFCNRASSEDATNEASPHLAIVADIVLPTKENRCLTVANLAVVVALYNLDDESYRELPQALLMSANQPSFDPFNNVSLAMGRAYGPTDFALS